MKNSKDSSSKNKWFIIGALILTSFLIVIVPNLSLMSVIKTDTSTNAGYLVIQTNVCDIKLYAYNSAGTTIVNGENLDCTTIVPTSGNYRSIAWLPPSIYKIVLTKQGYQNAEFYGVIILTGSSATLNNNPITMVAGTSTVPTPPTPVPTPTPTPVPTAASSTLISVWNGCQIWGIEGQYNTFYVKDYPPLAGQMFHDIIAARTAIDASKAPAVTPTPTPTPIITQPPTAQPTLSIPNIISQVWDWIKGLFGLASIVGTETINVGAGQQSYVITVTSPESPDSVYTDKTYSELYGTWFVVDNNQNIIAQKGGWSKLSDPVYTDNVVVTFLNAGTYSVVSVIVKTPYTYTTSWIKGTELIVAKEQMKVSVTVPQPTGGLPTINILDIIQSIWNWIMSFFK